MVGTDDDKKVYFSRGNLQYQASTNTWRFAEHQFDFVGKDNEKASATYDGWIDLLGWGTSGYNHGAVCYQPWSFSQDKADYKAYGDARKNLYDGEGDDKGMADWGYANPISNGGNQAKLWRTLTGKDDGEWYYLFYTRENHASLWAQAMIGQCDTRGLIILPDEWNWAENTQLSNLQSKWKSGKNSVPWKVKYTYSEWAVLEAAGAVFLPVVYRRSGPNVWDDSESHYIGYYWSSSWGSFDENAYHINFNNFVNGINANNNTRRDDGFGVRLVRNAN